MNLKSRTDSDGKTPIRNSAFPVVAIGASAGGLEALEQFFINVPKGCGMAFVVIQHLDPNYKGMMPELIQRVSNMKVLQVSDHLKVNPDTVYVIPPNRSMSILKGRLHLFDLVEAHGLRLPINFFFHSLADDMGERGVGIILSGMGSDGTEGLQSVKERGGLTIVQEPSTAGYDSMPKNAIQGVKVDIVAPPGEMPGKIISILNRTLSPVRDTESNFEDKTSLEKIVLLIRLKTGHDFSQYKKSTIYRRVERRMMVHKIDRITSYIRFLQENPGETEILFKELLIGATSFFRDPELWELLSNEILPALIKAKPEGYILRLWIAGCSTGEEAYSYAIALREIIDSLKPKKNISFQIFASDLDSGAIERARKGIYNEGIAASVSGDRLNRFFTKTGSSYKVNQDIREIVIFAGQNMINDPPFTKIDIISCRNVLIYHEQDLQQRLLALFNYSLNDEGLLILGTSETTGTQSHLFNPVNSHLRIFKKISQVKSGMINFPPKSRESKNYPTKEQAPMIPFENIQSLTDKLILQQYSPAGVLVTVKEILST
jgi:two-component system, chemotaxis family, CheB/CheR fusion protein